MISRISRLCFSMAAVLCTAVVVTACGGGGDTAPGAPVVTAPTASVFAGGNPDLVAGTGYVDGPGNVATFRDPYGLAVAADGSLLVADVGNLRIRRIDASGTVGTVATVSFRDVDLQGPVAVAVSKAGKVYARNTVYRIGDSPTPVVRLEPDGSQTELGRALRGVGLAVDASENVFVTTNQNSQIFVFAPDGSKRVLDFRGEIWSDRSGAVYVRTAQGVGTIDAAGNISYLLSPLPSESASGSHFTRDDSGNFYFVGVDGVFKVSPSRSVTKILSLPDPLITSGGSVTAVVWNAGALYLTVQASSKVVKISPLN